MFWKRKAQYDSFQEPSSASGESIGIIAGGGQFPLLVARSAKASGLLPFVCGFHGHTDAALEDCAEKFSLVYLGQLGKLVAFFREHSVKRVCFAGAINKPRALDIRPDLTMAKLLFSAKSKGDDVLLRTLIFFFEGEGFDVVSAADLVPDLRAPAGVLGSKQPSQEDLENIAYGWPIARSMGAFDIGQCLVVRSSMVIGVECIEGTDACLTRSGELGGKGCVAIKMVKPGQDERIDLPSVGLRTIELLSTYGYSCLALEAGKTLFFDKSEALRLADSKKIAIVALSAEGKLF